MAPKCLQTKAINAMSKNNSCEIKINSRIVFELNKDSMNYKSICVMN